MEDDELEALRKQAILSMKVLSNKIPDLPASTNNEVGSIPSILPPQELSTSDSGQQGDMEPGDATKSGGEEEDEFAKLLKSVSRKKKVEKRKQTKKKKPRRKKKKSSSRSSRSHSRSPPLPPQQRMMNMSVHPMVPNLVAPRPPFESYPGVPSSNLANNYLPASQVATFREYKPSPPLPPNAGMDGQIQQQQQPQAPPPLPPPGNNFVVTFDSDSDESDSGSSASGKRKRNETYGASKKRRIDGSTAVVGGGVVGVGGLVEGEVVVVNDGMQEELKELGIRIKYQESEMDSLRVMIKEDEMMLFEAKKRERVFRAERDELAMRQRVMAQKYNQLTQQLEAVSYDETNSADEIRKWEYEITKKRVALAGIEKQYELFKLREFEYEVRTARQLRRQNVINTMESNLQQQQQQQQQIQQMQQGNAMSEEKQKIDEWRSRNDEIKDLSQRHSSELTELRRTLGELEEKQEELKSKERSKVLQVGKEKLDTLGKLNNNYQQNISDLKDKIMELEKVNSDEFISFNSQPFFRDDSIEEGEEEIVVKKVIKPVEIVVKQGRYFDPEKPQKTEMLVLDPELGFTKLHTRDSGVGKMVNELRCVPKERKMEEEEEEQGEELFVPTKNSQYSSPLLNLRSFRAFPEFYDRWDGCASNLEFSNKINPHAIFCRFEMDGTCNDEACPFQHMRDVRMTDTDVLTDICSYFHVEEEMMEKYKKELIFSDLDEVVAKIVKEGKRKDGMCDFTVKNEKVEEEMETETSSQPLSFMQKLKIAMAKHSNQN